MTSPDQPDIFFVRHGETDWNAEGRYQGKRDIPLNDTGRQQADANGPVLRRLIAERGYDATSMNWYVSPLGRTRETAQRLRAAFEGELRPETIEDDLAELSFGDFEGFLHHEVEGQGMQKPGERDLGFWTYRPQSGESYDDVALRVQPVIDKITTPAIVVAHGGIARVFRHLVEGCSKIDVVNWPVPQNAVFHFTQGRMDIHESGLPGKTF